MINLNRYELYEDAVLDFFEWTLDKTNILSSLVFDFVKNKRGNFFTLLPNDIDVEKIYQFRWGGFGVSLRDVAETIVMEKLAQVRRFPRGAMQILHYILN